jgi:hypothetical protein
MCCLSQISGYSYSRVAVIWINVHYAGENSTNTSHAFHTREPSIELDRITAPEKKAPNTIRSMPTVQSAGPYPVSLSSQPMKQWRKPNICWQRASRLTGSISPTCDRYVQYLLVGVNPSVINQHRQGLQSWRCQLSIYYSLTFPIDSLYFPPRGPARSPI